MFSHLFDTEEGDIFPTMLVYTQNQPLPPDVHGILVTHRKRRNSRTYRNTITADHGAKALVFIPVMDYKILKADTRKEVLHRITQEGISKPDIMGSWVIMLKEDVVKQNQKVNKVCVYHII